MKDSDGDIYEGLFRNGKLVKSGDIKITFADGRYFEGTWEDEKWTEGFYRHRDGEYTGPFAYDEDDRAIKSGDGTLKYDDGRIYVGPFVDDKPEGEGVL